MIVTGEIAIESLLEIFVVFFFYDGPTPLGVFDEFDAIPYLTDGTKTQSYYDLVNRFFHSILFTDIKSRSIATTAQIFMACVISFV